MHDPEELFQSVIDHLNRATASARHPFRLCHLVTYDLEKEIPESRMVVCRGASDDLELTFYTDSRSPKVLQLEAHPTSTVVFWHPRKQIQLRLRGTCKVHLEGSSVYEDHITRIKSSGRISDYTSPQPPGSTLQKNSSEQPISSLNFAVITFTPESADILQLHRDGHKRIRVEHVNSNWTITEVVP